MIINRESYPRMANRLLEFQKTSKWNNLFKRKTSRLKAEMPKPAKMAFIQKPPAEKFLLSKLIKQTAPNKLKLISPKVSPEKISKKKAARITTHQISLKFLSVARIKTNAKAKSGMIVVCKIIAKIRIKVNKRDLIG